MKMWVFLNSLKDIIDFELVEIILELYERIIKIVGWITNRNISSLDGFIIIYTLTSCNKIIRY